MCLVVVVIYIAIMNLLGLEASTRHDGQMVHAVALSRLEAWSDPRRVSSLHGRMSSAAARDRMLMTTSLLWYVEPHYE